MKRVVFLNDLKESDIRPENVYNEYKELLSRDIKKYFFDASRLVEIPCPGCANREVGPGFNKLGFNYRACSRCSSFFVSPRPTDEALRLFYKDSRAGTFLRKSILGKMLQSRSENIFSYRIQWILGLIEEYVPNAESFLDYATRYPTFLKELNNNAIFTSMISILPECFEQENLLPKSVKLINSEDVKKDSIDVFTAFEVVEKIFDPQKLFSYAYGVCKKKGLCIITSTTSSGFEYQVLGKYSPNLIPPDRLNLLSLEALTGLIEKSGFEIIEVSTPGRLDVEMVKKAYEKEPSIPLEPFWKYIFRNRDENALHSFQEYLQQFQLSSHIRIAAVKR